MYLWMLLSTIYSPVIEEINQYCSTYQSVPLFWPSWEKVEMKTELSLPLYFFALKIKIEQNLFYQKGCESYFNFVGLNNFPR